MTPKIHNCSSSTLWLLFFLIGLVSCNPDVNNEAEAHFDEGVKLFEQFHLALARDEFNKALAIEPEYADALFFRGETYKYDDPELAINDFTQVIAIDPEYQKAYSSRADAYFFLAENEDYLRLAIKDYGMAITLDPTDPDPYSERSTIYTILGQTELALADLDSIIKLGENIVTAHGLADAYLRRSKIHEEAGDFDQALSDLEQTIKLNPELGDILESIHQELLEKSERGGE